VSDDDLERLYKEHERESHIAGLRAVFEAGFVACAEASAAGNTDEASVVRDVQGNQ
jgi:hypothetical protein